MGAGTIFTKYKNRCKRKRCCVIDVAKKLSPCGKLEIERQKIDFYVKHNKGMELLNDLIIAIKKSDERDRDA